MQKALIVGINYTGSEYELRGCHNDAADWSMFLGDHMPVKQMLEEEATKASVLRELCGVVDELHSGETGAFVWSGHGTQLPDRSGDEPDHWDEALVPYDMGNSWEQLLLDDELGTVFAGLVPGARLIFIADACCSGTMMRGHRKTAWRKDRYINPSCFGVTMHVDKSKPRRQLSGDIPALGVILYAGCQDEQSSEETQHNGRIGGVLTRYLIPAFKKTLAAGGAYVDVYKTLRDDLPSKHFSQVPELRCESGLYEVKLF